jgi:hypothetical protein
MPLQHCCDCCGSTTDLTPCVCDAILYCSHCSKTNKSTPLIDHKASTAAHRSCSIILSAREKLSLAAAHPRAIELSKTHGDTFHCSTKEREYIGRRKFLIKALREIQSRRSVEEQLDHVVEVMRVTGHHHGNLTRRMAPLLMLRLDYDQQFYDFTKGYTVEHLNFSHGSNPFEDLTHLSDHINSFGRGLILNATTLLKIKLILDIKNLQNTSLILLTKPNIPREILLHIRSFVPRSPLIATNYKVLSNEDYREELCLELQNQAEVLCKKVEEQFPDFLNLLKDPSQSQKSHFTLYQCENYKAGFMKQCYNAWVECPGALEWVRKRGAYEGEGEH